MKKIAIIKDISAAAVGVSIMIWAVVFIAEMSKMPMAMAAALSLKNNHKLDYNQDVKFFWRGINV